MKKNDDKQKEKEPQKEVLDESKPSTSTIGTIEKENHGKKKKMKKKRSTEMTSTSTSNDDSTDSEREGCSGGPSKSSRKKTSSKNRGERVDDDEEEEEEEKDGPLEGFKEMVCSRFRVIVSQNRRRIKTDGFDLDLTYITDRIIAMGYPANATEALYRNSMKNITRFLEKRHKDHYKVFNLRGQYSYDPANFKNRVISFEMTDHHPPRLELMAPFCREVHEWLLEHPENVVAVHCKAGKGRTGVMICAYLSYCRFYLSPRQNMDYYSVVRTRNNKGVTIPSQRRYVYYYDHLRKHTLNYLPLRVQLVGVYLERPPRSSKGPLLRDQMSLRVANADVDVYYGDPMNISDDTWNEEEAAWSGNVISRGEGSYDPNNPKEGCDVISRRAYGWTVPADKPVFLEGDVRVDLYVQKKFSIFASTGRNKLGHIWFNTMFACPGAAGSKPFMHGDEQYPYPEGETAIAERKNKKFVIGDEEESPGGVEKKESTTSSVILEAAGPSTSKMMMPLSLITTQGQSKSSPMLSPDRSTPSTSIGAQSTPTMVSKTSPSTSNTTPLSKGGRKDMARKSVSKLSKAGKAAKKFFSASDGAKSRQSEPLIHVSGVSPPGAVGASGSSRSSSRLHRRSNPETSCRSPLNIDELHIAQPPGLDEHCPEESLNRIYRNKNRTPPRVAIAKMLREAHEKDIVRDNYNERRKSVPNEGEPVKAGPDGRQKSSTGPNRILRNPDEHVDIYPVMEIDRAFKNSIFQNEFKIIVVTKCVEQKMARHSEAFINVTHEKQKLVNDATFAKSQRGKSYVDQDPKLAEFGAGKTWPPVIQYGNAGMQGNGGESATLTDDMYRDDSRARDERTCRYFYKQRSTSISRYPSPGHVCPLTGQVCPTDGGSMRSERVNTGTTIGSRGSRRGSRGDVTPIMMDGEGPSNQQDLDDLDDDDIDVDVRSWHPERPDNWEQSASSRSSSSSEECAELAPNSSMVTEEFSGVDSSMNDTMSPIERVETPENKER